MAVEKVITIKGDTKQAIKSFDALGKTIQEQKDITIEFEKELSKLERQLKDTPKSNLQAQKSLKKRIEGLKDAVKDQRLSLKELNNERGKSNKLTKTTTKNLTDNKGAFNLLNKATGGLATRFRDGITAIKGLNLSLKATRLAIAATGIGALLLIIVSLIQAFKKSEEGQNKFAKIMGVIGSVVGNVTDLLADLGEFIIDLFSGEGKAVKSLTSFGKKIFDVVGLPIKNLIDTVKTLGKVLGALFSGDIDGAFEALNQGVTDIKDNFIEAGEAITGAKDALVAFGKEIADDAQKAADIADKRAKADIIDRKLLVERAEATKKINELRFKAEQREKFTASERIKLLSEASKLEEGIVDKQIAASNLRLEAKLLENELDKNSKDDLNEIAKLEANALNLSSRKLRLQRLLQTQITTAVNDEKAAIKIITDEKQRALDDEAKAEEDAANKRLEFQEQLDEAKRDLDAKTREEKLQLEQDRAQEDLDILVGTEEEKLEAQLSLDILFFEKRQELKREQDEKSLEDSNAFFAKQADIAKKSEDQKTADLATAEKAKQQVRMAALNNVSSIGRNLKILAGKNKKLQAVGLVVENAAGIAKIAINTAQAVTKTQATFPGPVGIGLSVVNIAAGALAAASAIKATATGLKKLQEGGDAGQVPSFQGGGRASAPSFNLVAGSASNQLAESIQEQDPVQAFVVSSDVTSSQELDRNITENASL